MRASRVPLGLVLLGTLGCTGEPVMIGRDTPAGLDAGPEAAPDHGVPDAALVMDAAGEQGPGWSEPFGACGDVIVSACPSTTQPVWTPRVLFDAAELGPGHRIVDTDGMHLWIDRELPDGHDTRLVVLNPNSHEPAYETHTLTSVTPLQPVAAAGRLALACSATSCSLHLWNSQMLQVQGDELPRSTNPIAIAVGAPAEYGLDGGVYAVGEGVYRFEAGTWSTEIAPEVGVHWRALSVERLAGSETVAVVGDNGRVSIKSGDAPWNAFEVGTTASLRAVSVAGDSILIGAEDGTLIRIQGGQTSRCMTGTGITSIDHRHPSTSRLQVVGSTSDGRGFEYQLGAEGCFTPGPAGILRGRMFTCGVPTNAVYHTDTVVWGTSFCAID